MDFFETFGLLLVFAVVLVLCYYATRLVGKKLNGGGRNKTMKIIETLPMGLDRCLYLILVGKKHFLFFSSKKGMELVSEIEIDELSQNDSEQENESTNTFDFRKIFDTYSGLSRKAPKNPNATSDEEPVEPGTSGILGGINRLRRINTKKE